MAASSPGPAEARVGMFCDRCGSYGITRHAMHGETGEFLCANCRHQFQRRVQPLFIVTGASGSGKTTIIQPLQERLTEYGVFDKDAMWSRDWDMTYNNFFRIASALAQGGRATVIVGTIIPEHLAGLSDRDLVGTIAYANLHCDPTMRAARLLNRRTWDIPDAEFIRTHQEFATWLLEHAARDFDPPMPTFDTTKDPPEVVAVRIAQWVRATMANLIKAGWDGPVCVLSQRGLVASIPALPAITALCDLLGAGATEKKR